MRRDVRILAACVLVLAVVHCGTGFPVEPYLGPQSLLFLGPAIGLLRFMPRLSLPRAADRVVLICLISVVALDVRCGWPTANVADFGAVGDGVADDTAAFQAAEEHLGELGGGILVIPCGDFRLGQTGSGGFYSGLNIAHSNITVQGMGDCSTLLPGMDHGGTVIVACRDGGQVVPCYNLRFQDFRIHDDDPMGHCQGSGLRCDGSEETHGIMIKHVHGAVVERVTFDSLGDESLDLMAGGSELVARDNLFTGCPSVQSGGSCVSTSGTIDVLIEKNHFRGGISGGPLGTNRMVDVAANEPEGVETVGVTIRENTFEELDPPAASGPVDGNWVDTAILVHSGLAAIRDVEISDNVIRHDIPRAASIEYGGSGFAREDIRILDNEIEGSIRMSADGLEIVGNQIAGGFGPDGEECSGGTADVDDPDRHALLVSGTDLLVADNTIEGHTRSCIYLLESTDVDIERNRCIGTSLGAPGQAGHPVITVHPTHTDLVSGLRVVDNEIVGRWSLGTDGVCSPICSGSDIGACDRFTGPGISLSDIDGIEVIGNSVVNVGRGGIRAGGLVHRNFVINAGLDCRRSMSPYDVGIALAHTDFGAPETPGATYYVEDPGEDFNPAPSFLYNSVSGANEGCLVHDGAVCLSRESPLACMAFAGHAGPWAGAEIWRNFFEGCDGSILEYRSYGGASRVGWTGGYNTDNNPSVSIHDPAVFDLPGSTGDQDLHEGGLDVDFFWRRVVEAEGMLPALPCIVPPP